MSDGYAQVSEWNSRSNFINLWLIILLFSVSKPSIGQGFKDPLDHSAIEQSEITKRTLMSIARAGDSLIAVGSRGLIIRSIDNGKSWVQVDVPVQSDLLAVDFPSDENGWVVGHDGIILNTKDGGVTWVKQLDGRIAASNFKTFYEDSSVIDPLETAAKLVARNFQSGPSLPYLDVFFEDDNVGYAVGSFGMLAVTVDGGKHWNPWMHRIENPGELNLNSVRMVNGKVYLVGEQGMIFVLDREKQKFITVETGYAGSFFGIVGNEKILIAFGLKGVAYKSSDGVAWESVSMPLDFMLTNGVFLEKNKQFLLSNSVGSLLLGDEDANKFKVIHPEVPMRYTDFIVDNNGMLIVTAIEGIKLETISN